MKLRYSLCSSETYRLGVAEAFSDYLPYSSSYLLIKEVLLKLFNDSSEEVRSSASTCFSKLDDDNISNYIDLITEFIYIPNSKYKNLIYALKRIETLPDITLEVCEQFFNIYSSKASNIRTETSSTAMNASELIFRIYAQTKDKEISKRCLDLIDHTLEIDIPGVERTISEYDR